MIFLTGSTGFIGNWVTRFLLEDGEKVKILVRKGSESKINIDSPNLEIISGDLSSLQTIGDAIKGCEKVFHLAALASAWSPDPGAYERINAVGTLNLLEMAAREGVGKFIFTSTAGTLATGNADESSKRKKPYLTEYERTKKMAEVWVDKFSKENKIHTVTVHPSRVYGPGQLSESNALTKIIQKYLKGNWRIIPGNGEATGNYAFVKDVARGHILASEKGKKGSSYILGGENASYNRFFEILREVSGKNRKMFHLPFFPAFVAGKSMALMAEYAGIKPLITDVWVKKYWDSYRFNLSKSESELGYRFTGLHEGFRKTIDWLKIHGE